MTASAAAPRPRFPWWLAGLVGMALGAGIMLSLDTSDRTRFPWTLEELAHPPYGWRTARYADGSPKHFPSKKICEAAGVKHTADTGLRTRCRKEIDG